MEKPENIIKPEKILEINLPDDSSLIDRLRKKLKEYQERAVRHRLQRDRLGRNRAYVAPEILLDLDTSYKILVLERLLKQKRVRFDEFSGEFPNEFIDEFKNAFGVIKAYAERSGAGTAGGTGLPEAN